MSNTTHRGSCHCGALRYEVDLSVDGKATRCNCSICTKVGATGGGNVKPEAFRLLTPPEAQGSYAFGPAATRYFCRTCGVHCYGKGDVPELGGAFVGINLNTLDDIDVGQLEIAHWDGRHDNWAAGLRSAPWPIAGGTAAPERREVASA